MKRPDFAHTPRIDADELDDEPPRRAPGRVTLTSRLPPRIQREASGTPAAGSPEAALARARDSPGQPLSPGIAGWLGQATGLDLGRVRIHDDVAAHRSARDLGARAFTVGSDIYFARGTYEPDSPDGRRLIAHEVAHTIQQRGRAAGPQAKLEVSQPGEAAEREADDFATAVIAGFRPSAPRARPSGIQREADPASSQPGEVAGGVKVEAAVPAMVYEVPLFEAPEATKPFKIAGSLQVAARDRGTCAKAGLGVASGDGGTQDLVSAKAEALEIKSKLTTLSPRISKAIEMKVGKLEKAVQLPFIDGISISQSLDGARLSATGVSAGAMKLAIKGDVTRFIGNFVDDMPDGLQVQIKLELSYDVGPEDLARIRSIQAHADDAEDAARAFEREARHAASLEARLAAAVDPDEIADLQRQLAKSRGLLGRSLHRMRTAAAAIGRLQQGITRAGAAIAGRLIGQMATRTVMRLLPYVGLIMAVIDIVQLWRSIFDLFAEHGDDSGGGQAGQPGGGTGVEGGTGAAGGAGDADTSDSGATSGDGDAAAARADGADHATADGGEHEPARSGDGPDGASDAGEASATSDGAARPATAPDSLESVAVEDERTRRVLDLLRRLTTRAAARGYEIETIDPIIVEVIAEAIEHLDEAALAQLLARLEARMTARLAAKPGQGQRLDPYQMIGELLMDAELARGGELPGGGGDAERRPEGRQSGAPEPEPTAGSRDPAPTSGPTEPSHRPGEGDGRGGHGQGGSEREHGEAGELRATDGTSIDGLSDAEIEAAVRWNGERLVGDRAGLAALTGRPVTLYGADPALIEDARFTAIPEVPIDGGGSLHSFAIILTVRAGSETRYLNVVRVYRPAHGDLPAAMFHGDDGGLGAELQAKLKYPHRDGVPKLLAPPGTVIETSKYRAEVREVQERGRTARGQGVSYQVELRVFILEATGESYLMTEKGEMATVVKGVDMTTVQTVSITDHGRSENR